MKIAHICDNLPPNHKGGAEVSCALVMNELTRRGHEVLPVTNATETQTASHISYIKNVSFWGCRDVAVLMNSYEDLKRTLLHLNPDIVHIHGFEDRLQGALMLSRDFPTVYTAHNYTIELFRFLSLTHFVRNRCDLVSRRSLIYLKHLIQRDARYIDRMTTENLPYLKKIICPSRFMAGRLRHVVDATRLAVVYNGVEDRYSQKEAANDPSKMLFVGRIDKSKGVHHIVRSAHRLVARGQRVEVTLLGGGRYATRLAAMIRRRGLEDSVRIVPAVPSVDYSQHAGIVVYPSIWDENCSMTILEALSAGKVVICSGRGGNKELIEHQYNGLVIDPDPEAITEALSQLKRDSELLHHLSANARSTFLARFTIERQVSELERIYCESVR
jgi:glycosyltransferase involved in cell wall biosynthesis